jgi:hypothetical protein
MINELLIALGRIAELPDNCGGGCGQGCCGCIGRAIAIAQIELDKPDREVEAPPQPVWKCLICEQVVEVEHPGDDSKACWPNVVGGHVEVTFGYGSIFDQCQNSGRETYQGCICDECVKKKGKLLRRVRGHRSARWEILPNDLDECRG